MGVDAKTRQRQLWDILGKPEKKQFAFDPILTGKRIGAGRGEYWYGQSNANGKDDGSDNGDKEGSDNSDNDGKNGGSRQSGGDPRLDPSQGCPKPGDAVPGLKNLRDCATGRCVNVGFTLLPQLPDGWGADCSPPKNAAPDGWEKGAYWEANYTKQYDIGGAGEKEFQRFKTRGDAAKWLSAKTGEDIQSMVAQGYASSAYRNAKEASWGSWGVLKHVSSDAEWQTPPPYTPSYPADRCAEMASTATGFKPACEEHDPNLPPQLKGDNSAIRLCDANGNEITIRRNGKGWVYETATCTVTVNDGGVVDNVRDTAP